MKIALFNIKPLSPEQIKILDGLGFRGEMVVEEGPSLKDSLLALASQGYTHIVTLAGQEVRSYFLPAGIKLSVLVFEGASIPAIEERLFTAVREFRFNKVWQGDICHPIKGSVVITSGSVRLDDFNVVQASVLPDFSRTLINVVGLPVQSATTRLPATNRVTRKQWRLLEWFRRLLNWLPFNGTIHKGLQFAKGKSPYVI